MDIKEVTPEFSVSPQVDKEDAPAIAEAGFSKIINNRPDGEAQDQPASLHLMTAISNAGMGYLHIPIVGSQISQQDIDDFRQALGSSKGPVLAFCRTGTRSIKLWALSAAKDRSIYDIIQVAARAGYDLTDFSEQMRLQATQPSGACHENA